MRCHKSIWVRSSIVCGILLLLFVFGLKIPTAQGQIDPHFKHYLPQVLVSQYSFATAVSIDMTPARAATITTEPPHQSTSVPTPTITAWTTQQPADTLTP